MIAGVRILIVEDDAALASGITRILEGEGLAVDVTSRGEQAVEAARQERFDLMILDVGLPGIDGFEVLRRLRAAGQKLPVLDRKSTRLNSSHSRASRMPSSA